MPQFNVRGSKLALALFSQRFATLLERPIVDSTEIIRRSPNQVLTRARVAAKQLTGDARLEFLQNSALRLKCVSIERAGQ